MGFIDTYCNFKNDGETKYFQIDNHTIRITKGSYKFPVTLKEALTITPDIKEDQYDTGYVNRAGYRTFNMDCLWVLPTICKFWKSDCNHFVTLWKGDVFGVNNFLISVWETIFWPDENNSSHQQLRDKVGDVLIALDDSSGHTVYDIYTDGYHLSIDGEIQKLVTLTLVALYDCDEVLEKIKARYEDAYNVVSGIKKLLAE